MDELVNTTGREGVSAISVSGIMAGREEQMALVPSNGGNGPSRQEAVPGGSYFGVGEPRRIFVHAPQYHWHQVSLQGVDDEARRAIEQMGNTLYE